MLRPGNFLSRSLPRNALKAMNHRKLSYRKKNKARTVRSLLHYLGDINGDAIFENLRTQKLNHRSVFSRTCVIMFLSKTHTGTSFHIVFFLSLSSLSGSVRWSNRLCSKDRGLKQLEFVAANAWQLVGSEKCNGTRWTMVTYRVYRGLKGGPFASHEVHEPP